MNLRWAWNLVMGGCVGHMAVRDSDVRKSEVGVIVVFEGEAGSLLGLFAFM